MGLLQFYITTDQWAHGFHGLIDDIENGNGKWAWWISHGLSSTSGLTIRWPKDYLHLGASHDASDINRAQNPIPVSVFGDCSMPIVNKEHQDRVGQKERMRENEREGEGEEQERREKRANKSDDLCGEFTSTTNILFLIICRPSVTLFVEWVQRSSNYSVQWTLVWARDVNMTSKVVRQPDGPRKLETTLQPSSCKYAQMIYKSLLCKHIWFETGHSSGAGKIVNLDHIRYYQLHSESLATQRPQSATPMRLI